MKRAMLEWVDPITQDTHTCPSEYVDKLFANLGFGVASAKTAAVLLQLMGEANTEANRRHLRHAALFMKQRGLHLISLRSSVGGYFLAETMDELSTYTNEQRKLANAMIREANALEHITLEQSKQVFDCIRHTSFVQQESVQ